MLRSEPHGRNKIQQTFSKNFERYFQVSILGVILEKHPLDNTFESSVKEFANCLRAILRRNEFERLYRAVVQDSPTPNMLNSLVEDDADIWKGLRIAEIIIQNETHLDTLFLDDDSVELLQIVWKTEEINESCSKKNYILNGKMGNFHIT